MPNAAPLRELLPRRACFRPGEAIAIEVRGEVPPGKARAFHLGDLAVEVAWDGKGDIVLPPLPQGGYGIELGELSTAVDVASDPRQRLRYGFVASYAPDKDIDAVADNIRRLHLTGVQFYDWAYRHADLMGGGNVYRDALDQPIALSTVRALVSKVQAAGSRALGYAAVYAVGVNEWDRWKHQALLTAAGTPYGLGDFLFILDPAAPDWLAHFTAELKQATAALGFDGYHLDQYGYPKRAMRADGVKVDLGVSFVTLIEAVRDALPEAHLVFNNVNDFPARRTAAARQDAVYIEPWEPQLTLQALANTVTRARAYAAGRPVVMAAYQHVYDKAPAEVADLATAFTMATLYSHGATHLLAGEADRLLCDPYYVRNHCVAPSTAAQLKRWYDFLAAHDELLMPPGLTEVTDAYAGAYNSELDVEFGNVPLSETAAAGTIWRRIVAAGDRLIVHLINLTGQTDTLWDAPRAAPGDTGPGKLRYRRTHGRSPRMRVADPDAGPRLIDIPHQIDGNFAVAELPPLRIWQMIIVD
jgi:dextranase